MVGPKKTQRSADAPARPRQRCYNHTPRFLILDTRSRVRAQQAATQQRAQHPARSAVRAHVSCC